MMRRMSFAISRRSLAWVIATGLLAAVGAGLYLREPPPGFEGAEAAPRFDAQGHRGARGRYPENTLPAFRHALATGVTTLEMDLQVTADGRVVVHHDPRLDPARTRGPDGDWLSPPAPPIGALSLADLRTYDVGTARPDSAVARRFPEQARLDDVPVPLLTGVLALGEDASGGRVRYNLETKLTPEGSPGVPAPAPFAEAVIAVAREAGVAGRTTIQSFDWRTLAVVRERAPEIARAYLTAERDWLDNVARGAPGPSPWLGGLDVDDFGASVPDMIAAAERGEAEEYQAPPPWSVVWAPYFRDLRQLDLDRAHSLGIKVVVWTVNDRATMTSLIDMGVDGIITDYPARLRETMRAKGLPPPPAYPEAAPAGSTTSTRP